VGKNINVVKLPCRTPSLHENIKYATQAGELRRKKKKMKAV